MGGGRPGECAGGLVCVWGGIEARAGGASAAAGVERTENGEHGDAGARDEGIKSRQGWLQPSSSDAAQLQAEQPAIAGRDQHGTPFGASDLWDGPAHRVSILRFDEAGAICGVESSGHGGGGVITVCYRSQPGVLEMYVVKRSGKKEPVHFDKITSRISKLAYGLNPDFCDPVRLLVVSSSSCSCGIFPCFLFRLLLIRLFV